MIGTLSLYSQDLVRIRRMIFRAAGHHVPPVSESIFPRASHELLERVDYLYLTVRKVYHICQPLEDSRQGIIIRKSLTTIKLVTGKGANPSEVLIHTNAQNAIHVSVTIKPTRTSANNSMQAQKDAPAASHTHKTNQAAA